MASSVFFGSLLGLALILLQNPIANWALVIISPSNEVAIYATEYIKIRIWAAPATLLLYGLNGWFLGMQNAKVPMAITIVLNLTNLLLNILFVLVLDWKVAGVALGSVIASYLGLVLALSIFLIPMQNIGLRDGGKNGEIVFLGIINLEGMAWS